MPIALLIVFITLQVGAEFLGVEEGVPEGLTPTESPDDEDDELSGGEIAAIVIVLSIAVIVTVLVVIAIAIFYRQRRRRSYLIETAGAGGNVYVTDATDTFTTATPLRTDADRMKLVESVPVPMSSKEEGLPITSIIATNEAATEGEQDDTVAGEERKKDLSETSEMLKSDEDTHF